MAKAHNFTPEQLDEISRLLIPHYPNYHLLFSSYKETTFEEIIKEIGGIECINKPDLRGQKLLHILILRGDKYFDIIKKLVELKVDIDEINADGITPLICALKYITGSMKTIQLLLDSGVDINKENKAFDANDDKRFPIGYICGVPTLYALFLENGAILPKPYIFPHERTTYPNITFGPQPVILSTEELMKTAALSIDNILHKQATNIFPMLFKYDMP